MLMFIVLWRLIMLQMKKIVAMVKDLNPQSDGE